MSLLQNSELLKIEDILSFFPDFVVIDDFKEEICGALEDYSVHIDHLKKEMDVLGGCGPAAESSPGCCHSSSQRLLVNFSQYF